MARSRRTPALLILSMLLGAFDHRSPKTGPCCRTLLMVTGASSSSVPSFVRSGNERLWLKIIQFAPQIQPKGRPSRAGLCIKFYGATKLAGVQELKPSDESEVGTGVAGGVAHGTLLKSKKSSRLG
jgi:hypothetical protein